MWVSDKKNFKDSKKCGVPQPRLEFWITQYDTEVHSTGTVSGSSFISPSNQQCNSCDREPWQCVTGLAQYSNTKSNKLGRPCVVQLITAVSTEMQLPLPLPSCTISAGSHDANTSQTCLIWSWKLKLKLTTSRVTRAACFWSCLYTSWYQQTVTLGRSILRLNDTYSTVPHCAPTVLCC